MKKYSVLFLCILICILLSGCKKKAPETIVFDESYPLALATDITWALVTDPYASFKAEADWNAETTGHCRKGEILQVLSETQSKEKLQWYKFEKGWLPDTCLTVYSNRFKAQSAANQLKD
ncbi:MAG: hypothetical protein MJ162_04935 [Treponema sp.]|nr:hypothetical protein [Treponema sp.]